MNAALPEGQSGERRSDLLALRLLELGIGAGWKPRDCIEFAPQAYKLVTSTLPGAATQQLVAAAREPVEIGQPGRTKGSIDGKRRPHRPSSREWGPDLESRRNALQALADQNRTMHEAAKILGVSRSLVASMAGSLKISFHGVRNAHRAAPKKAATPAKLTNGVPTPGLITGAAVWKLVADRSVDRRMKRRCPACNQIFEPTGVSQYLCDDCENGSHAAG
jgi:hypothetical protein